MKEYKLSINSFLSLGATDGPGVRSVVFLNGCPLRCMYCHNPETWGFKDEYEDVNSVVEKILKYEKYYKNGGGLTVSGGEPLCQATAIRELFKIVKREGIHTCIDTSACVPFDEEVLDFTDMAMVDLKFLSDEEYQEYTGKRVMADVVHFIKACEKRRIPIWIRHVLVPNITDNEEYVKAINKFCSKFSNIEKIELLPYKNLCEAKYKEMNIPFRMAGVELTPKDQVEKLKEIIKNSC